ncbi:hypothetical protein EVAR_75603_1 [Eumeta japonica]|uniref:Uncharacterized protein n=1 Tax=Eumeta variegata TaxID=151549 RepID=A0A4C1TZW5_EUMVA|nr:hypothetical protein EVAR_75603_1 [Eumeta japonica]
MQSKAHYGATVWADMLTTPFCENRRGEVMIRIIRCYWLISCEAACTLAESSPNAAGVGAVFEICWRVLKMPGLTFCERRFQCRHGRRYCGKNASIAITKFRSKISSIEHTGRAVGGHERAWREKKGDGRQVTSTLLPDQTVSSASSLYFGESSYRFLFTASGTGLRCSQALYHPRIALVWRISPAYTTVRFECTTFRRVIHVHGEPAVDPDRAIFRVARAPGDRPRGTRGLRNVYREIGRRAGSQPAPPPPPPRRDKNASLRRVPRSALHDAFLLWTVENHAETSNETRKSSYPMDTFAARAERYVKPDNRNSVDQQFIYRIIVNATPRMLDGSENEPSSSSRGGARPVLCGNAPRLAEVDCIAISN